MGILFSCCRKKKPAQGEYKKVEARTPDLEAGGGDDDEDWDDFGDTPVQCSGGAVRAQTTPTQRVTRADGSEAVEDAEPEVDPFAGFDMAPKINKTKRHDARDGVFTKAAPVSSRFAMTPSGGEEAGGGWGDEDDLGDDFGVSEKRRAAEQRREARRQQREAAGPREKRGLAASRVEE